MPLSRASLPVGTLAALLLGGCAAAPLAGAPPPAPAAGASSRAGTVSAAEFWSLVLQPVTPVTVGVVTTTVNDRDCDPGDPMAFDPGPRVDSLTMHRVPGGWAAPMPNACPVDARFRETVPPGRYTTVRIRGSSKPAPKPR